jgi:hypothetical protein
VYGLGVATSKSQTLNPDSQNPTRCAAQKNARRSEVRGDAPKIALGVGSRESAVARQEGELIVINQICLRLFSLLPITVVLAGVATLLTKDQR